MKMNLEKPLVLVGGGGHCRSVIGAARRAGFRLRGILDAPEKVGQELDGVPFIGTDDDIPSLSADCQFVITVGMVKQSALRRKIAVRIEQAGGELATVVDPSCLVSEYAEIGEGTVIINGAFVNAGARIGRHAIINSHAVVEHDVSIGDFTHISTGALVNGAAKIGSDVMLGSGTVLLQGIEIADEAVIGAGSVVCRNITESGVYVGLIK